MEDFVAIGQLQGHQKAKVTPYMHILALHVPQQMEMWNGIKRFSGQGTCIIVVSKVFNHTPIIGVEKNNDDARRNVFSSNQHDALKEILLTAARLETLASYERQERTYTKHDDYWDKDILTKRARADNRDT